jgi:hypothetical protein
MSREKQPYVEVADLPLPLPSAATMNELRRACDRFFERRGIPNNSWGRTGFAVGKRARMEAQHGEGED